LCVLDREKLGTLIWGDELVKEGEDSLLSLKTRIQFYRNPTARGLKGRRRTVGTYFSKRLAIAPTLRASTKLGQP